jgi:hypothetical protein
MAGRGRITFGLALLVAAIAVIGRSFLWVAWPLSLFAVFLIFWGRSPQWIESYIAQLPGGRYLLRGLRSLDAIITPRDPELEKLSEKRREFVDQAFLKLTAADIRWLHKMSVGGRPIGMPGEVGNSIGNAGLLEYDFTGITGIRSELKPSVDEKLKGYPEDC